MGSMRKKRSIAKSRAASLKARRTIARMKEARQEIEFQPMRLGRMNLGPDDVLVITSDRSITEETAESLIKQFKSAPLPFKNKVLVLAHGLKLGKISKSDDPVYSGHGLPNPWLELK
jgi:hypothetical protein